MELIEHAVSLPRKALTATFLVRPETSDVKALEEVWKRNRYQRKGVEVVTGDRWVDGGANVGGFAVLAGLRGCKVLAVEAEPENAALVAENIAHNGLVAETRQAALMPSDYAGDAVTLYVNSTPLARRRHTVFPGRRNTTAVAVPATNIEKLVAEGYDCFKLNIEGCEIRVLETADFTGVRKIVAEWSFDKDPKVARLFAAMERLRSLGFVVAVDKRIPEGLVEWKFYPPNIFLYAHRGTVPG